MTSLYQLSTDYQIAFNDLIDSDFDQETIDDTLEGLKGMVEEKGRNVAAFMQNLEADAKAMKDAEKRMAARRKNIESAVKRFKEYLRENMTRTGITKISSPEFSVTLRKPLEIVEIFDEEVVPLEFLNVVTISTPDKREILKALKAGHEVMGAKLSHGVPGLTIR